MSFEIVSINGGGYAIVDNLSGQLLPTIYQTLTQAKDERSKLLGERLIPK